MNSDDEEIVLETDDVVDAEENEIEPENDTELEKENNDENEDYEDADDIDNVINKMDKIDENDDNDCIDIEDPEINISDVVVPPEKRTSKNKMTRYEFVRIIGERVMQLTKGAKPLIKQNKQSMELSYKEIAIEELKANMIPFKIRRFVKDHYEIWKIDELNKKHLEPLFY
jgi:DNA-directed RNA polymerase subunit K/omega